MKTIFKQALKVTNLQTIQLPRGFKILHLGMQADVPTIWYECDTTAPMKNLNIYCFGTGFDMDHSPARKYIGTVQFDGFVWHYYHAAGFID